MTTKTPLPREIWILVAAAFLIAIGYGLIAPILPQFVVSFDVSIAAAGMVVSIFSVSRLLGAPAVGRFIDKVGSRKVYLTGLVIVALTTGCIAVAQHYWHILALRAIAGFGSTMFSISAMGLVVRLSPPDSRGRASAMIGTAFLVGNVIGPIAGASMAFLGMRVPFVIYGFGVLAAAFVVWWLMPNAKIDKLEAAENAGEDTVDKSSMAFREVWHDSAFRAVLLSNFAQGWVNMGVRVATIPLFAAAVFDRGAAMAGLALAAFAAGNAIVLQFSGRLADTIGRRPLILSGLVGTGIFIGLMGFSENMWSLLLVSVLAGGASGLISPAQQAVVADLIGAQRSGGKVLSSFQMCMDAGQIIGPILVGVLADAFGFRIAFLACTFIAAMALIGWGFGRETLSNPHKILLRRIR